MKMRLMLTVLMISTIKVLRTTMVKAMRMTVPMRLTTRNALLLRAKKQTAALPMDDKEHGCKHSDDDSEC